MTVQQVDIRSIRSRRTFVQNVVRTLKSAPPSAVFGMSVIGFYAFCALFAPFIAPFGEAEIVGKAYGSPDGSHWFGLDQIGRDTLSRVIYGARNTIGIASALSAESSQILRVWSLLPDTNRVPSGLNATL